MTRLLTTLFSRHLPRWCRSTYRPRTLAFKDQGWCQLRGIERGFGARRLLFCSITLFVVVRCFIVKHPFLLHFCFSKIRCKAEICSRFRLLLHQFPCLDRCTDIIRRYRGSIAHPSKDTTDILIQLLGRSKLYNPSSIHHTSTKARSATLLT
jgi:hypothetical protein